MKSGRKGLAGKAWAVILAALLPALLAGGFLYQNTFEYTNLADAASRDQTRSLLEKAGVSRENAELFLRLAEEFYEDPYPDIVESGFRKASIPLFAYSDAGALQHLELQPDGSLTCRMAAFLLLRDRIAFPEDAVRGPELVEKDPKSRRVLTEDSDLLHFDLLFANRSGQTIRSSREMSDVLTEYWAAAGIVFPEESEAHLVTAYGSDGELIQNFHTAVVLPGEGELWLLEKYDPIYPYQLSRFRGEDQIVDYLKRRLSGSRYAAIFSGGRCLWTKR